MMKLGKMRGLGYFRPSAGMVFRPLYFLSFSPYYTIGKIFVKGLQTVYFMVKSSHGKGEGKGERMTAMQLMMLAWRGLDSVKAENHPMDFNRFDGRFPTHEEIRESLRVLCDGTYLGPHDEIVGK